MTSTQIDITTKSLNLPMQFLQIFVCFFYQIWIYGETLKNVISVITLFYYPHMIMSFFPRAPR